MHLPKIDVIIAQQLGSLAVDGVDNVTIEKVACNKARKNFSDLLWIVETIVQSRQKLVSMQLVNAFDVGKNSIFLTAQRLRQVFIFKNRRVVVDACPQRIDVIFLIL